MRWMRPAMVAVCRSLSLANTAWTMAHSLLSAVCCFPSTVRLKMGTGAPGAPPIEIAADSGVPGASPVKIVTRSRRWWTRVLQVHHRFKTRQTRRSGLGGVNGSRVWGGIDGNMRAWSGVGSNSEVGGHGVKSAQGMGWVQLVHTIHPRAE
jgi:hypothetical protein